MIKRPVKPLGVVFDEYLNDREIDFMSVDTEGFDLEVLQSNNWNKYKPTIIMVECGENKEEIVALLETNDYKIAYQNHVNVIFLRK